MRPDIMVDRGVRCVERKGCNVTAVLLTYESTAGLEGIVEASNNNSQVGRTGVNACSIKTKLYNT